MPKSNRKKKLSDAAFQKVKKRVGKKQVPTTATNTDFSTRLIHMPSQSIVEEKTDLTTNRRLTLKDLLANLSHHNAAMRRQALDGIRELMLKAEAEQVEDPVRQHLGMVLKACCGLISDETSVVKTLLLLFSSMLRRYSTDTLEPHAGLVMMYVCSGTTHLVKRVRYHALELLGSWVEEQPALVAKYCSQVLRNLASLVCLHQDVRGSGSADQALAMMKTDAATRAGGRAKKDKTDRRVLLFRAVLNFLTKIPPYLAQAKPDVTMQEATGVTDIAWGARVALSGPDLSQHTRESHTETAYGLSEVLEYQAADMTGGASNERVFDGRSFGLLCKSLFPALMEHWLQCVPSEYPTNSATDMAVMELILAILSELHSLCTPEEIRKHIASASPVTGTSGGAKKTPLDMFQRYVVVHFPFRPNAVRRASAVVVDVSANLNRHICLVLCNYVGLANSFDWAEKLFKFCTSQIQSASPHVESLFGVVLKLVSLVVAGGDEEHVEELQGQLDDLLDVFTEFFLSRHFRASAKAHSVALLTRVLRLSHASCPAQVDRHWQPCPEMVGKWASSLPKVLWQLRVQKPELSHAILELLLLIGKQVTDEEQQEEFDSVQSLLVPFFYIKHKEQEKFGPFISLAPASQKVAVEVLFFFSSLSGPMLQSLAAVSRPLLCSLNNDSAAIGLYLVEVVRQKAETFDALEYVGFLLNTLVHCTVAEDLDSLTEEVARARVAELTERLALHLRQIDSKVGVPSLVQPALQRMLAAGGHALRRQAVGAVGRHLGLALDH